jgi:uncharacterized protein (TIGR04255 family)
MPNHRYYPHAPITEALIDFRVNYGRTISLANLKSFGAEVKREYPLESNRDLIQGQFDLKAAEPKVQSSKTTVGYIFHSADRRQSVQARLDGFTVSRLAPYQTWEQLRDETKRLWTVFREALRPVSITRVSVRYINQINLPFEGGNLTFEDYLQTFPKMEADEDIFLEQFFMRLVMPQNDLNAKLILTEALLPPQDRHLGVILDIDLFREDISIDAMSMEMWDILEEFRNRKNRFFESTITDATRKLFA